jgi:hypothetical protein
MVKFVSMKLMSKPNLLKGWPFLLALLTFVIVKISTYNPLFTEKYYSEGLYPYIASTFSFFSNLVPFSIWDIFWIVATLLLLAALILVLIRRLKLSTFLLRLFQSLAIIYSFFYFAWGLNYFRPKIENRIGWAKPSPDEAFFREILDTIIVNTNKSYSVLDPANHNQIDSLVEKSYQNNAKALGIDYPNGSRTPKTMILSSIFAKSGVSGYFGPFFNEIHLNEYLLPFEYPFTLAHEKAHQFGITDESEANFAAFIVCTTAGDKRLQYSGNMQLLLYFLSDAHQLKDRKEYVDRIDSLVIKDIQNQKRHWQALENKTLDKVQTAANNAYLKTNRIHEGVKNYNQVVSLVITWYFNKMQHQKTGN